MTDQGLLGIENSAFEEFRKVVAQVHKPATVNSVLSVDYIEDRILEWIEKHVRGEIGPETQFVTFLSTCAGRDVRKRKVAIPVSFLTIDRPFCLGAIMFEYLRKDLFDEWESRSPLAADGSATPKGRLTPLRKRYQGVVCCSMEVEGETTRAIQRATTEARMAINVLRFFTPACAVAVPCFYGLMGRTLVPTSHALVFDDPVPDIVEGMETPALPYQIMSEDLKEFERHGWNLAGQLLTTKTKTAFEETVFDTIQLFARAIEAQDTQDKLLYALVAAETLLLRDQSEPILVHLWLRLAFLVELDVAGRREIKELVQDAYKRRSAFVHHGEIDVSPVTLSGIFITVWTAIRNALVVSGDFKTKADFLDYLENRILT
ncbi:MAG: hypothetical protein HZB43_06750 [candidate division Zixibacteria bacterium]|nr:hypothetical protein [candidate division Zixibacteria bacterium]